MNTPAAHTLLTNALNQLGGIPKDPTEADDRQWAVYRALAILGTEEGTQERYETLEAVSMEIEARLHKAEKAWDSAYADQCAEEDAASGDPDRISRARAHYGSDEGGYPGAAA